MRKGDGGCCVPAGDSGPDAGADSDSLGSGSSDEEAVGGLGGYLGLGAGGVAWDAHGKATIASSGAGQQHGSAGAHTGPAGEGSAGARGDKGMGTGAGRPGAAPTPWEQVRMHHS